MADEVAARRPIPCSTVAGHTLAASPRRAAACHRMREGGAMPGDWAIPRGVPGGGGPPWPAGRRSAARRGWARGKRSACTPDLQTITGGPTGSFTRALDFGHCWEAGGVGRGRTHGSARFATAYHGRKRGGADWPSWSGGPVGARPTTHPPWTGPEPRTPPTGSGTANPYSWGRTPGRATRSSASIAGWWRPDSDRQPALVEPHFMGRAGRAGAKKSDSRPGWAHAGEPSPTFHNRRHGPPPRGQNCVLTATRSRGTARIGGGGGVLGAGPLARPSTP